MVRLGVRAHDFGKLPADVLAQKISEKGFTSIQLTLQEAIKGIDTVFGKLNPGMANHIGETFRKQNIQIAVLSCYINPIHPDKKERKKQIDGFKEYIRYARDFGCSIVATETGSVNTDFSFSPQNHSEKSFQTLLKSIGEMVEEAEKFGVFVGIEGVEKYVAYNPQKIKRMLDTFKTNNLQIVFDPVNLLSASNYIDRERIIEESFELFGDKIAVFHAKDFIIDNGCMKKVQIGEGLMDYEPIIKLLEKHKPYTNFIMEEIDINTVDDQLKYIKDICCQIPA